MQVDPSIPYFGLVSRGHINNAVLYLPPAHPIVAAYELALGQLEVLPDSLPAYYKLTQFFRKLAGKPSMPWQLRHAMYGPRMLTGLARRTDTLKYALPIRSFHAVHWKPELFFEKRNFAPLVEDPQVLGLHISPGIWERKSVVAGSLCEWAGRNVGMPA